MLTHDIYSDFGGLSSPCTDAVCPIIGTKTERAVRVIPSKERQSVTSLLCPTAWFETQTEDGVALILNSDGLLPSREQLDALLVRVQNTRSIPQEDVLTINEEGIEARAKRAGSGVAKPSPQKTIYLYLAKNRRNGLTKIGITINPVFREHTLMSQEPEVDFIFHRIGTRAEEKLLHSHFANKRVRGEWFSLTESDVNWCKSWDGASMRPKSALPLTESSNTENTTTPSGKARDSLLDALVSQDGSNPLQVTASAFGAARKALKEIRGVMPEVTATEISRRGSNYRALHPDWTITPLALSKHWAVCDKGPAPQSTIRNATIVPMMR